MQNFRFRGQVQNDAVDQTSAPTRAAGLTGSSRIAESASSTGRSQANLAQLSAAVQPNLICFGQVETTVARFTTAVLNNISVRLKRGRSEHQFLLDRACCLPENCRLLLCQVCKIATLWLLNSIGLPSHVRRSPALSHTKSGAGKHPFPSYLLLFSHPAGSPSSCKAATFLAVDR